MANSTRMLNTIFTQKSFFKIIEDQDDTTYKRVVQRFITNPHSKNNGQLISEIYSYLSDSYRNEYFYKNTLLNKLLLGKHSLKTTTALSQIPIGKSIADMVLINGKAVVYEIKSDLDSLERLKSQLSDYFLAFDHVCVVTSEKQYPRVLRLLADTPVGIYVMTKRNTLSKVMRKEPIPYTAKLNHQVLFEVMHRREYERILMDFHGHLPSTSQVHYYEACLKLFKKIPIIDLYQLVISELKSRNRIDAEAFHQVPVALKSMVYFSKPSKHQLVTLQNFLQDRFKE